MVFGVIGIPTVNIETAHCSKEPCLNQTRQHTPTTVEIRESHGNVP
ncbi:hypothetical protein TNCV_4699051, partial [Trichonephila clavipes]